MVAPNLTRDQASERSAIIGETKYAIVLDLTDGEGNPGEKTFRSLTTITFAATAGASTFVDIVAGTIRSATLNGTALDTTSYDESTGLALVDLAEHNELVVDADCVYSHTGEGLHRFVDPVDGPCIESVHQDGRRCNLPRGSLFPIETTIHASWSFRRRDVTCTICFR